MTTMKFNYFNDSNKPKNLHPATNIVLKHATTDELINYTIPAYTMVYGVIDTDSELFIKDWGCDSSLLIQSIT